MKTKNNYLNGATGEIPHDKKGAFSADLALSAEQRGVPAHIVFREFGKREKLSPREYGQFAFAARYHYGDVPVAIALLYHTLELTPQTVKQANLPGRYLGMPLTDLSIQGGHEGVGHDPRLAARHDTSGGTGACQIQRLCAWHQQYRIKSRCYAACDPSTRCGSAS